MTDLEKTAYILIRRKTAESRAELARKLGVSRPTASTVTESLLKAGLVREGGKGKSTGGATPTLLCADEKAAYFIGIDFGYTDKMSAVLTDGSGSIIRKEERNFDPADLSSMAENARILVSSLAADIPINGIAVALSAVINEESRQVRKSINPLFCDGNFTEFLEKHLGYPVFPANRSRAAAISEAFGGAADKEQDFALISLGKSVGAAFWCGGGLFCGSGSSAGEIRNLRLPDGRRLETALAREKTEKMDRKELAQLCAEALSQIIDIMDIKLLVLSGRFADFGSDFASLLEEQLAEHGPVKVRQAKFGRFSAARGSAFQMAEIHISRDKLKQGS